MSKNTRRDIKEEDNQSLETQVEETKHEPTRTFEKRYYEFCPTPRVCILTRRRHWKSKSVIRK